MDEMDRGIAAVTRLATCNDPFASPHLPQSSYKTSEGATACRHRECAPPHESATVAAEILSPERCYLGRVAGCLMRSLPTLGFRGRGEVESSLAAPGYRALDVRAAPDRPGREFVFIAERTT